MSGSQKRLESLRFLSEAKLAQRKRRERQPMYTSKLQQPTGTNIDTHSDGARNLKVECGLFRG